MNTNKIALMSLVTILALPVVGAQAQSVSLDQKTNAAAGVGGISTGNSLGAGASVTTNDVLLGTPAIDAGVGVDTDVDAEASANARAAAAYEARTRADAEARAKSYTDTHINPRLHTQSEASIGLESSGFGRADAGLDLNAGPLGGSGVNVGGAAKIGR